MSELSDEGPVFFRCKHGIDNIQVDVAEYAAGVEAERRGLAKLPSVQVRYPVSGATVDRTIFIERDDEWTYSCGALCREKFESEPGKYPDARAASFSY